MVARSRLPGRVVHQLPGRVRVKLDRRDATPDRLGEIERTLAAVRGIRACRANPTTGTLLIHYDAEQVDLPELAGLARAADAIALDGQERQAEADDEHPHSSLAQQISARFGGWDRRLRRATGGRVDLKMLLPITFGTLAVRQIVLNPGNLPAVPWYVLLWYAFDSYVKLHHQAERTPGADESTGGELVKTLIDAAESAEGA
jgi:hypothetical protein